MNTSFRPTFANPGRPAVTIMWTSNKASFKRVRFGPDSTSLTEQLVSLYVATDSPQSPDSTIEEEWPVKDESLHSDIATNERKESCDMEEDSTSSDISQELHISVSEDYEQHSNIDTDEIPGFHTGPLLKFMSTEQVISILRGPHSVLEVPTSRKDGMFLLQVKVMNYGTVDPGKDLFQASLH